MDRQFKSLQKQLGNRVRELRKAQRLSQEALALEAGVDRTYVSQIERGIANSSLLALFKLSRVLKVSITDLL
jgi:transcriptional regulator with XRE-family HTH domain